MAFRIALAIAVLCACRGGTHPARDPHSFAEPDRVSVKDLALDLTVDFSARTLAGTARLELTRHVANADRVVLDSDGLTIAAVTDCATKQPLAHRLGKRTTNGQPLVVTLGSATCIEVAYKTAPEAGALLWVDPAGTLGREKPMLFTQSQATRARSWIPLQDSPSVRFPYRATIRVPAGMWALMSCENPQTLAPDGVWQFAQPRAIPSYLMALAVGDFAFRPTGPRSGVYAEPALVEAAAYEFGEVEAMIASAERLYGPYRWGRYDMLVLPPSFPYGGMENPNLSFLTPTVISGDRSLVSLIAHELAHSWSGNLVTNKTWNDLWLNEGFTTYVERRIMEELRGKDTADVYWYLGTKDVEKALARHGATSHATRLSHAYGSDRASDDIPADLAYDKGALFLRTLEVAYGRPKFDAFLRGWFDHHAFSSVDSKQFAAEAKAELGTKVDLETWLFKPGLPADAAPSPSTRANELHQAAVEFAASGRELDASKWSTLDWVIFLRALPEDIALARLHALDARHHLTTGNAEIKMHWLPKLVVADDRGAAAAVEKYLVEVGRNRMIKPLYTAMAAKNEFWRELAKTTFARVKPSYHPATRESIQEVLEPKA